VGLKITPHQVKHFGQDGVTQAVEDLVALFPVQNDLFGPKYGQMLRVISLLNPQFLNELSSRERSIPE
jgi:hypothetical protein